MSLAMLGIFGGMVGMALNYPPETRLLPLVIGIPGIFLAAIQVGMDMAAARRAAGSAKDSEAEESAPAAGTVKRELVLLAYLVALATAILSFGFWLTIPVFVIVFLRTHEGESWRLTLGLALGVWAGLYLIFDRLLEILVHRGFVIDLIFGCGRRWIIAQPAPGIVNDRNAPARKAKVPAAIGTIETDTARRRRNDGPIKGSS